MPSSTAQWAMLVFFVVGSLGGWAVIFMLIAVRREWLQEVRLFRAWRRAKEKAKASADEDKG